MITEYHENLKSRFARPANAFLELTEQICHFDMSLHFSVQREVARHHEIIGHFVDYRIERRHVVRSGFNHHFHAGSHKIVVSRARSGNIAAVSRGIIVSIGDMCKNDFVFLDESGVRLGRIRRAAVCDRNYTQRRHQQRGNNQQDNAFFRKTVSENHTHLLPGDCARKNM